MKLNAQEIIRYSKQLMLDDIGPEGQLLLKNARVLIIGAGGLGCPVAQYLNGAGVGTLGIAEFDVVEATNLHRQILYGPDDIGKNKGAVMVAKLAAQNPFTQWIHYDLKVTGSNVLPLVSQYDLIVDGCDNFATRYVVNDACVQSGKPLVYGSILGYEGQLAVFNHKGSKNLRDVFPTPPNAEDVPSCSENGVLATVPGIVGTTMAQAALMVLLGQYQQHNQYLLLNTLTGKSICLDY